MYLNNRAAVLFPAGQACQTHRGRAAEGRKADGPARSAGAGRGLTRPAWHPVTGTHWLAASPGKKGP